MKQIIRGAYSLVLKRIETCIQVKRISLDQESISFWTRELDKALRLKMKLEKRFKIEQKVIYADFPNKRRFVA